MQIIIINPRPEGYGSRFVVHSFTRSVNRGVSAIQLREQRFSLDHSALPKLSCSKVWIEPISVWACQSDRCFCLQKSPRRPHHGEPAITRERKHFSKIHPSDCKPSTRLACSYLNWSEEVSAALCSAVDRTSERMNDKTTTVTLRPRVNNNDLHR